ncbi:histidinol dehydrogenase [Micrococcus luteus]|uniref:histidinol dehydrogenase n=1 Tax=Micrococcus luteus TaxID=1270 RepID=UPI00140CF175|nr:histidinol dehydrogenase [Micrococcus luteus]MCV7450342.1 histidinol dehydrogenase [Micrococcus luteus]MCV7481640.1 histidinol dehydrogenase [Micrococcus luteus]MCV7663727.1 histidinol dehydrogenase [Micrococcus luteus]MCV7737557.1 histidinol dehydrogenase [Micrococcus luteus]NHQ58953.1 histidinol dehydrogenase [Micrococcus luteus]
MSAGTTTSSPVASTVLKSPAQNEAGRGSTAEVRGIVENVIADIRERGDAAVREYSQKFDNYGPESFLLTEEQLAEVMGRVPQQVIDDITFVQDQVRTMAQKQRESLSDFEIETLPGVRLGQKNVPVQAAGAYIPGGKYPLLASAHMTIVTAKVAGVERVAACTPLIKGEMPDATIAAMHLAGADEIYLLGGIQAVAAMAVGTETIKPVNMLAGPGNAFVAEAKRQLFGEVGIDLFAGPTEVLIVADEHADPFVVAVDLLSQAEHGPDSPAVLITTSEELGRKVIEHVDELLVDMPTKDYAEPAWRDWGAVHVVENLDDAYALADKYAYEHVQILTENPREALEKMRDYGALFLGEGTCVSYGDKVIGTNHVLPTRGAARYTGGLWVGKYLRTVTYQEVTDQQSSAFFGELCGRAARVERFEGHARSGDVRAAKYRGSTLPWSEHTFGS